MKKTILTILITLSLTSLFSKDNILDVITITSNVIANNYVSPYLTEHKPLPDFLLNSLGEFSSQSANPYIATIDWISDIRQLIPIYQILYNISNEEAVFLFIELKQYENYTLTSLSDSSLVFIKN